MNTLNHVLENYAHKKYVKDIIRYNKWKNKTKI